MTTRPKFKSDAFEPIHSSAQALFKVGVIDKSKLRDFDYACLTVTTAIKPPKS